MVLRIFRYLEVDIFNYYLTFIYSCNYYSTTEYFDGKIWSITVAECKENFHVFRYYRSVSLL